MAVLHRARSPSFWTPFRVPTEQVEIDWTHPLANGLVACYIPGGASGFTDLCGIGPTLGFFGFHAGRRTTVLPSPAGPGITYTGVSSGAGAVPAAYQFSSAMTMHLTMFQPVLTDITFFYIGVTGATPFSLITVSGSDNRFRVGSTDLALGTITAGFNTFTGSWLSGTARAGYVNGTLRNSAGTATPGSFTGAELGIATNLNNINTGGSHLSLQGLLYNRVLSASEVAWLGNEPFGMLRPVARRTYAFVNLPRVGAIAVTEAADTIAATGAVAVVGTIASTEAADTIAASGRVAVAGAIAATEAADTMVASGTVGPVPVPAATVVAGGSADARRQKWLEWAARRKKRPVAAVEPVPAPVTVAPTRRARQKNPPPSLPDVLLGANLRAIRVALPPDPTPAVAASLQASIARARAADEDDIEALLLGGGGG